MSILDAPTGSASPVQGKDIRAPNAHTKLINPCTEYQVGTSRSVHNVTWQSATNANGSSVQNTPTHSHRVKQRRKPFARLLSR